MKTYYHFKKKKTMRMIMVLKICYTILNYEMKIFIKLEALRPTQAIIY